MKEYRRPGPDEEAIIHWDEEDWYPIVTCWGWRGRKEQTGMIVGECTPIGPQDLCRSAEYVPVRWSDGTEGYIHKSKINRI